MGEVQRSDRKLTFNRSIRIGGCDEHLSSSAGLLLVRELDERWKVIPRLSGSLIDPRRGSHVVWSLQAQLRARIFALVAGYGAQRDVAALGGDPVLRLSASDRRGVAPLADPGLMSQPTLARLHRVLGREENQAALKWALFDLGVRVIREASDAADGTHTIDVDSMPVLSHGQQPGSVWNGYYRSRCFHPLMAMHGETGTMLSAELRPGNVPSASGAKDFVLELLANFEREVGCVNKVRGDSSFVSGELLDALEARGTGYVFRFANNSLLRKMAGTHVVMPKGPRPSSPREWLHSLTYKGRTWKKERRVILVVQEVPGELYLHHFFLITNDRRSKPETILAHYRQRGTSESRFGELKSRLQPKLSCTSTKGTAAREAAWKANASTFHLYLLADGLLHALRWLTKNRISEDGQSLPRLQRVQRWIIDVAARLTTSARRVRVHVAANAQDIWLWALARMGRLRPVT
jgi:hypothetical protein